MPVKTAQILLNKYWDKNLPINPARIAEREGVKVEADSGLSAGGLSGEILPDGNSAIIRYNPADSEKRRRFTIAHELGHFSLGHGHAFRDPSRNFSMSYFDPREVAANWFAAELLMPEIAVSVLVKQRRITSIEELARLFNVSLAAMKYRLNAL